MQKTMMRQFTRLKAAFSRASASQWVAYIIVMIAIAMLIYAIVDHIQSPRVTELYSDKMEPITENESDNCDESRVGAASDKDPECTNTALEKCNKLTFGPTAVFEKDITIFQPDNTGSLATGMESINFCNNAECSETRSLQDVVNEYKHYHIPSQLHKVYTNRVPIAREFGVLMNNRCKINQYIGKLKANNDSLDARLANDEIFIMKKLRDIKTYLQNSIPKEVENEETNE